jgi:glucan 1,6-alpha-glucosidase
MRGLNDQKILIVCNFYGNTKVISIPELINKEKELLISNYNEIEQEDVLRPYETRMYLL